MFTVLLMAAGLMMPASPPSPGPAVSSCEEDQPCWDCTTMGNRICGPDWYAVNAPEWIEVTR